MIWSLVVRDLMRIITGSAKNRRIATPKGKDITRPAMEKVRGAIFSSLGLVEDLVFLDVFAGSGSLGLEALSRGAAWCDFIDAHPVVVKILIENLTRLGFADVAHVYKRRLPQGLSSIDKNKKYDVIFCDPPYDKNFLNPTLSALLKHGFIDDDTQVIVEHTKREMPATNGLEVVKFREYGQTCITFLRRSVKTG